MKPEDLIYIIIAHQQHPIKPSKAFRKWNRKTPYFIHPLWCASMIATETCLDERTREEGIQTLLYHDVLEDTRLQLPGHLSERVKQLIEDMTFSGNDEEIQEIWQKPQEVRLYKLYDKVSNLLDGSWMSEEKREQYTTYTQRLCQDAKMNYGTLNITKIAEAIL